MEKEPKEISTEPIESLGVPESLRLAEELEKTDDNERLCEDIGKLLDAIENDLGVEFTPDINSIYDGMRQDDCLVRVETLSRVLRTMKMSEPLSISDEDETHYANAVVPLPEGIKIALAEGQAPGPVRLVVGFGKTLIGFKTDHISVSEIDFNEHPFRDENERKYLCRHVSGNIPKEDIHYLTIRIPFALMKKERLTQKELDNKPSFVSRGVHFSTVQQSV